MERRKRKTRQAILTAFETLLGQKRYELITVQNIIDTADVGRSTFYTHFETKDALLQAMCADMFAHVLAEDLAAEGSHDFSGEEGAPATMIAHILYHLQDQQRNIRGLLTCESRDIFLQYFRERLHEALAARGYEAIRRHPLPDDFLRAHLTGSFVNMAEWWLRGGCRHTPEEMADMFAAVTAPIFGIQKRHA